MKIANSNIQLASQNTSVTKRESKESLRVWVGNQRPDFEGRAQQAGTAPQPARPNARPGDAVVLSQAAQAAQPTKETADSTSDLTPEDELKMGILVRLVEHLTGKKMNMISPKELTEQMRSAQEQAEAAGAALQGGSSGAAPANQPAGFGIEYDSYEMHYEAEKTTFAAQGLVQTQDGRQIAFAVDMSMSREFLREQSISIRAGDAVQLKDPLVINFGGNAAELTQTRFSFDIDSDGKQDQIAFVGANSGFLALDKNGDGVINNGRELFGASTGNGFAELAAHDEDGNGWIDENDSIYSKLRIWSKDEQGRDQLVGLGERGVGAIYLGHVTTPFSIKNQDNDLLGQVRSSGVFLHEDGRAGTVQQIDLSV